MVVVIVFCKLDVKENVGCRFDEVLKERASRNVLEELDDGMNRSICTFEEVGEIM